MSATVLAPIVIVAEGFENDFLAGSLPTGWERTDATVLSSATAAKVGTYSLRISGGWKEAAFTGGTGTGGKDGVGGQVRISAWVRIDSGSYVYAGIFGRGQKTTAGHRGQTSVCGMIALTENRIHLSAFTDAADYAWDSAAPNPALAADTWYKLVLTIRRTGTTSADLACQDASGNWLQANGTWAATFANCLTGKQITTADRPAVQGEGWCGVIVPFNGAAYFDDFSCTSIPRTYYVDATNGNDANNGETYHGAADESGVNAPWKTLQYPVGTTGAWPLSWSLMAQPVVLNVAPGTYQEQLNGGAQYLYFGSDYTTNLTIHNTAEDPKANRVYVSGKGAINYNVDLFKWLGNLTFEGLTFAPYAYGPTATACNQLVTLAAMTAGASNAITFTDCDFLPDSTRECKWFTGELVGTQSLVFTRCYGITGVEGQSVDIGVISPTATAPSVTMTDCIWQGGGFHTVLLRTQADTNAPVSPNLAVTILRGAVYGKNSGLYLGEDTDGQRNYIGLKSATVDGTFVLAHEVALCVGPYSTDCEVRNCTIVQGSSDTGSAVQIWPGAERAYLHDNVIASHGGYAISLGGMSHVIANNAIEAKNVALATVISNGNTNHLKFGIELDGVTAGPNRITVMSGGTAYSWVTGRDGGNNVLDNSIFTLLGTATYGTIGASSGLVSVSAVRSAWNSQFSYPANDANSGNGISTAAVVAAAYVVAGHDNYTGGTAGNYPTTAASKAEQLAADYAKISTPAASQILAGVTAHAIDSEGNQTTVAGTLTEAAAGDVRHGAQYGAGGNAHTGTAYIPVAGDVRHGTSVDATTGTCRVPTASQVLAGVAVDATTGTLDITTDNSPDAPVCPPA